MTEDAKELLVLVSAKKYRIKELARKVGLNECTQQKCFKHLFGVTFFESSAISFQSLGKDCPKIDK